MKVILSNYRNHWLSPYTILKTICFWEKDEDRIYNLKEEPNNPYEKWVNFLDPICKVWHKFLDIIHPRVMYVKIDRWDTWSMDHTLAHIIHPMLVQLNETKHGAPNTDDEDVPLELRRPPEEKDLDCVQETDVNWFNRWDYVLNEMIWAFEQKLKDDDEGQFFDHSECGDEKFPWNKDGQYVSKIKIDKEGLKKHQKRKANGFRLFGKYYQNLWD
jgi:hypothetical protein